MTDPYSGRHRDPSDSPKPGPGNRTGTYDQMQILLKSQAAANKATEQAMAEINIAMRGMNQVFDSMFGDGSNPYAAGPNGGRPTTTGNQTRRPTYSYSPYEQGANQGYGHGLTGVRGAIARHVHENYGRGSASQFHTYQDRDGNTRYRETRPDGSVHYHDPGYESTSEGSSALAGAASRGTISDVAMGFGARGLMGGAKAIPYVGAAILGAEAVHEGLTFVSNQRAANAPWQSIYGGSNFDQFGQRASQFGFGMSNLFNGGLTWGDSQKAFQGVSALGYQGQQRSQDLGFITQNYMRMGVSVSDSLKLITIAAKDLNESLTGLQTGLKDSRDAAIAAGMAGTVGTQIYTQTLQNLSQYPSPSGGTANLAGPLSVMQASMGRNMSDLDLSSMLTNPSVMQMMGRRVPGGMPALEGMIGEGDPRVITTLGRQLTLALSGAQSTNLKQYINRYVQQAGGPTAMDPGQVAHLANEILINNQKLGLNALGVTAQARSLTGLPLDDPKTLQMVIQRETHTGAFNTHPLRGYGIENPYFQSENWAHSLTGGILGHGDATINPTIDAAKRNSTIAEQGIQVTDKSGHTRYMSLDEALRTNPEAVAKGTAVVAGTGGKTVRQMLGGEHQKYYLAPGDDRASMFHNIRVQKAMARDAKSAKSKNTLSVEQQLTDAMNRKKDDDWWGVQKFQLSKTHSVGDVEEMLGGKISAAEHSRIQKYVAQKYPKTDSSQGDDAKNKVTVSLKPDVAALFDFHGSGNVLVANSGASSGSMPRPGN